MADKATSSRHDYDIFISHSSKDTRTAIRLYEELQGLGLRVFLDARSLTIGERWDDALPRALQNSFVIAVIVSAKTEGSYYLKEEIATAIRLARRHPDRHRVVPVFVGTDVEQEALPYGLAGVHGLTVGTDADVTDAANQISNLAITLAGQDRPPMSTQMVSQFIDGEKLKYGESRSSTHTVAANSLAKLATDRDRHAMAYLPASLLFVDVDGLTQINKQFGEHAGDAVVAQCKAIAAEVLQVPIAEIGSDEFAAMLPLDLDGAMAVASTLVNRVHASPWKNIAPELHVTISVGVGLSTIGEAILSLAVRSALGCRAAKADRGNGVSAAPLFIPPAYVNLNRLIS